MAKLREEAQTSHKDIFAPILAFARSQLNSSPPGMPQEHDLDGYRNAGNQVIALAFAYVITGDSVYLDLTRRDLLAYASWQYWGDEQGYGQRDLGFHHMVMGNSIALDWVYNDLSGSDRNLIVRSLASRAQGSYEASSGEWNGDWNNWWRKAYVQNHNWINNSALGIAALVLEGTDERAQTWLGQAVDSLKRDSYLAQGIADGSWHEGIPYQTYLLTMTLPFLYNLDRLKGIDLLPHDYLRNYTLWRVYNSLPGTGRFVLSYGDFSESWADSYGPQGVLRFIAHTYGDGHAEWMAEQLESSLRTKPNAYTYTAPWKVFEFLYFDPSIKPRDPGDLPLARTFPDFSGVIWRTGWGPNDLVFGLKTSAFGGRFMMDQFLKRQYPFDDPANDVFDDGHDHLDSNSFYIYKGSTDLSSEQSGEQDQQANTGFHNTLLVDGKGQYRDPSNGPSAAKDPSLFQGTDGKLEQSAGAGAFDYLVADATNRYWTTRSSDGGPDKRILDEFRRYVLFVQPGYIVMVDNIRSQSAHRYEWVSHFGGQVTIEGDWVKGTGSDGRQLLGIKLVEPASLAYEIGDDGKKYVRLRPQDDTPNARFAMVLMPTDAAGWAARPDIHSLGPSDQAIGIRVTLDGTQDHVFRVSGLGKASVGEYVLDGVEGSVIRGTDGGLQRFFVGGARYLADNTGSRVLVESPETISALQVEYRSSAELQITGNPTPGTRVLGPGVDPARVTVNGQPATVSKDGDYIVFP